jgi:hypothetical protein
LYVSVIILPITTKKPPTPELVRAAFFNVIYVAAMLNINSAPDLRAPPGSVTASQFFHIYVKLYHIENHLFGDSLALLGVQNANSQNAPLALRRCQVNVRLLCILG